MKKNVISSNGTIKSKTIFKQFNWKSGISEIKLQLANTEEYIDGALTGNLGEALIRCNNVLYIRGIEEDDEDMDK